MSSSEASGSNTTSTPSGIESVTETFVSQPEDEARTQKALGDADDLKHEGNEHFRAEKWNEALAAYRSALGHLPKRQVRQRDPAEGARPVDEDAPPAEVDDVTLSSTENEPSVSTAAGAEPNPTPLQLECAKARSILNANIAACFVKLGEHADVVAACTEALIDDASYVKALQRRAASNEQLDTWSSLTSSQEDYTRLLTLLPPSSSQYIETRRRLNALKPRVETAQKRETSEMMDKLKGIGNSILGNFGLSTGNFQFTPNGQGGYSMQFGR